MADTRNSGSRIVIAQAALIYAAFAVTLAVLFTDKNLQTNFGLVKTGYFLHWYGLLATAVIDVVGASILILKRTRGFSIAGTIGTLVLALFLVFDMFTYSMVGGGYFTSYSQFGSYLFGFSKLSGSLSYIPGLFDVLFAVYVAAFIAGIISVRKMHA